MAVYGILVAITLVLGGILPQRGKHRWVYVVLMALILTAVSALRDNHMAGDLKKYHWEFLNAADAPWLDPQIWQNGRNAGFYLLMKLVNHLSHGEFQWLLIFIAAVSQFALAGVIGRYSPKPWMSYLVYLCMGFFSGGLATIKQTLAMALVLLAFRGIAEEKPKRFAGMTLLAGLIHLPALVVLAIYPLTRLRLTGRVLLGYLCAGAALYVLKVPLVTLVGQLYYGAQWQPVSTRWLGNRFIMIGFFAVLPLVFGGFRRGLFEKLFPFMAVAALAQMFSGFDHVFSRLADYCLQFSVLYLPMALSCGEGESLGLRPLLHLNKRSMAVASAGISVFLIWFYHVFYLAAAGTEPFRFLWERAG